jgi:hypothetical protein
MKKAGLLSKRSILAAALDGIFDGMTRTIQGSLHSPKNVKNSLQHHTTFSIATLSILTLSLKR